MDRSILLAFGTIAGAAAAVVAAMAVWILASQPNGVSPPRESLRHSEYSAYGSTANELKSSMSFWLAGHWGYAAWKFTIPRTLQTLPEGSCAIKHAHVAMELEVRAPAISFFSSPNACLRNRFGKMREALDLHEEGHLDIARAASVTLTEKLAGLPAQPTCAALMRFQDSWNQRK